MKYYKLYKMASQVDQIAKERETEKKNETFG